MDKIKVAVRARPLNKRELDLGAIEIVTINESQVVLNDKEGKNIIKSFTYDCCFDSTCETKPNYADQKKVFDELGREMLDNVFTGYNTCMFAYGQTGSGKSYTMMGADDDEHHKGLIPRLCECLFEIISADTDEEHLFKIEVSYMEIYNEKVRDLLDPSGSKQNLKLREHRLLGVYVDGLTQLAVASYKDIEVLMNKGNKSRTVAATNMNAESSRSHAVFCLQVSQNIIDKQTQLSGEKLSRLSLVDLAGSEKVAKTGAEGFRLKEGCNINKSLTTLGLVISTLADNISSKSKLKHIPYRDSVLTWLLKDSLGGNSKTIMISTISTASDNYDETLSTLRYADRAKRIVNNAVVNEDPNAKLIRSLRDELEMLKRELEKTREQLGSSSSLSMPSDAQLNDRLKESEKLFNDFSKPWTEKLAESKKIQHELSHTLQSMGISVHSSGIKVETDQYFLVNINSDPSMNELLVYYLKETNLIGRPNAETKQDIQLIGPGVGLEHCIIQIKNNCVFITPMNNSKTRINGVLIKKETKLHHGDRIEIGINHFFRLNCPTTSQQNQLKKFESEYDLIRAQEEILFSKLKDLDESEVTSDDASNENLNNKSLMSTSSSSSSSSIGQPVYEIIQNSAILNANDEHVQQQILLGYKRLRNQLVKTHSLAREANSIARELNLSLRFTVTLHTPAKNLTPNHKKDTFLFEPALAVKLNNEQRCVIDMDKFEIYCLNLREMYFVFQNNPKLFEDDERKSSIIDPIIDQIVDSKLNNTLIGVANVYLDSLFVQSCIEFEYDVPIINEIGDVNGKLKIKLQRLEMAYDGDVDDEETPSRKIRFKLNIVEAIDLPKAESNSIYCQYQFWIYSVPFIVRQLNDNLTSKSVKFNYENEFSIEMTDEFMEYCLYGCLSIELYGQNLLPKESKKNKINTFDHTIKYDNLIQNWSDLSKSFEVYVHILELNTDGNWQPVEVKQHDLNQTGGIYQLKQGQSRQISVRVRQTNPGSKIWYNGALFNLEPHKIDKISVGCVLGREIGLNHPLDSYQEIDLNKLKEKCKNTLELRKQYIYEQLKELETLNSEEDKEKYELLCKQLVELGEEIAALDAPPDNSNLPGSTIDWQPAVNMEEHVPIIFLDLKSSLAKSVNLNDSIDSTITDYDDYERIEAKKAMNSLQSGHDSFIKFEKVDTPFYDLKIIRWNNSEMIEFSADGDVQENDLFDDADLVEKSLASPTFKALALWDSSIHNSPYLNQITPFDKHVYITLKINLKLKFKNYENVKFKYVDLVLRKRLAVNVYTPSVTSSKLSLFKNLLVSNRSAKSNVKSIASSQHSTSLIYRVIADVPRCLSEVENRELFALKATSPSLLVNETDSVKISFFENYLKTIRSVDAILKKDRADQQQVIKNTSKSFYKKSELNKSFNSSSATDSNKDQYEQIDSRMKKTFSVPNLIKNSLSVKNTINQAKETSLDKLITNESVSTTTSAALSSAFDSKNTPQMIDSARVNNLSFRDIILTESNQKSNQQADLHEHIVNNTRNQINKPLSNFNQSEITHFASSSPLLNSSVNNTVTISSNERENKENLLTSNNNNNIVIEFSPASKSDFLIEKDADSLAKKHIASNDNEVDNANIVKSVSSDLKTDSTLGSNLDSAKSLSESNHSIASTLTNSSQVTNLTSQEKQLKRSQESLSEHVPDWMKENVHVIVSTNTVQNKRGYVRYIGLTKFAQGVWIGVELEEPHGKNDGALKGVRYFKCPENRGVFVKPDKLTLVSN